MSQPMPYTVSPPSPIGAGPNFYFGAPLISGQGPLTSQDEQAIVQARTQQINQTTQTLVDTQTQASQRSTQLGQLAGALMVLHDASETLGNTASLLSYTASSSNTALVTAALGSHAAQGTYSVNVTQLAQAQSNQSQSFPSTTSSPLTGGSNSGSLSVQGGQNAAITIAVDTSTTLTTLAQAINASGQPFRAEVIAQPAGNALVISGTQTGQSNILQFTESNLALNLAQKQTQAAQDAQGTINGTGFNSVTNVLNSQVQGVTLNLLGATPAPVNVVVASSAALLPSYISAFVASFNAVVNQAAALSEGNTGIRAMVDGLLQEVGATSATATGQAKTLAEIGVHLGPQNLLQTDNGLLAQAILNDAQGVATLFANGPWGAQAGIADNVAKLANDFGQPLIGTLAQMAQNSQQAQNLQDDPIASSQYASSESIETLHQTFTQLQVTEAHLAQQNLELSILAHSQDPRRLAP